MSLFPDLVQHAITQVLNVRWIYGPDGSVWESSGQGWGCKGWVDFHFSVALSYSAGSDKCIICNPPLNLLVPSFWPGRIKWAPEISQHKRSKVWCFQLWFLKNLVAVVWNSIFASDRKQGELVSQVLQFTVCLVNINTPFLEFKAKHEQRLQGKGASLAFAVEENGW